MGKEQLPYCMTQEDIKLCEIRNGTGKVNRESLFIVSANVGIRGWMKWTDVKPSESRWFFQYSKLKTLYSRVLWMVKCTWVWQVRQKSARKISERLLHRDTISDQKLPVTQCREVLMNPEKFFSVHLLSAALSYRRRDAFLLLWETTCSC